MSKAASSIFLVASGLLYLAVCNRKSARKKDKASQTSTIVITADTDTLIRQLSEYKKRGSRFTYVIGVDVGATNFRTAFILTDVNNVNTVFEIKLQCHNMNEFRDFYAQLGERAVNVLGLRPEASVLALAGPIKGDTVEITNYDEGARDLRIDQLTETLFPKGRTKFINDLEAACYGIISLGVENRLNDYMASLWVPNEKSTVNITLEPKSYAVLAMGTGLGVGLIQFNESFQGQIKFKPLPLEAGHCLIPLPAVGSPYYDRDIARLNFISKKLYSGKYGVEYEDICSGRGLQYCYEYELTQLPNYKQGDKLEILTPGEIAIKALHSKDVNSPESRALLVHYKYLMEAAQNVCIMVPSIKGVFFAGDNQLANEQFVLKNAEIYKEVFLTHPKQQWVVPLSESMYRQKVAFNFNLEGTRFVANQIKNQQ